ncbi:selenocysteine lyase [Idiomarina tyrosinivorans]|uniref:Selenocysteine lyase n=1 Tax=Idiomarina tyrosinivorans TaxID=1445662 RepID=A0A432ZQK2_9GAMM|nr:aminotransferase class V-fold PLP-dependent enzyme [Idiomarina tyrosinivorans]RUO80177.1 selenocysteine lyase [Idiomarina tyrosinivorans]
MKDLRANYREFLQHHQGELHCAPHSHHYWPDVTLAGHQQYWLDSAKWVDDKWNVVLGERLRRAQQLLSELVNHPYPEQWVFASNTHELLYRILSCFAPSQPLRILTTDSEFHSFRRQALRLQERETVTIDRVACDPIDSFPQRWQEAVKRSHYDVIFISQVFFNSGFVAPWVEQWLDEVSDETVVVIDGYHGCGALPTDLANVADRIFYLAGGYKYLQAGEGACFMSVPKGTKMRPEYTGWYADFANLEKAQQQRVEYADNGFRFAGSTMDYTAMYRLIAVLEWWQRDGITVAKQHQYIEQLQQAFLQHIDQLRHPLLNRDHLLYRQNQPHGHFFAFEFDTEEQVQELSKRLKSQKVLTDHRGKRLRFGFAPYQRPDDYRQIKG